MRIPAAAILQGDLIPIGRETDPALAALGEPLACVLRGQTALHVTANDVVLIMGVGPIGIMHVMLARLQGARRVIVSEVNAARLEKARMAGADRVVNSREEDLAAVIMDETNGEGADVIITAAPAHAAQESAVQLAAIGGRIKIFFGLPPQPTTIQIHSDTGHYNEKNVTCKTGCSTAGCWPG